jgi:hypothetical protein
MTGTVTVFRTFEKAGKLHDAAGAKHGDCPLAP